MCCLSGLDDDMKADAEERNGNKSDSDSDDTSSRRTTTMENGYLQPVETAYVENAVEELGQVCHCLFKVKVDFDNWCHCSFGSVFVFILRVL